MKIGYASLTAIFVLCIGQCYGALTNGSFELPNTSGQWLNKKDNGAAAKASNWVYAILGSSGNESYAIGSADPCAAGLVPADGTQMIAFHGYQIMQNTGQAMTAGVTYTVNLFVSSKNGAADSLNVEIWSTSYAPPSVATTAGIAKFLYLQKITAPLFSAGFKQYSVSYTANADDQGKNIMISMYNPNFVNDLVYVDGFTLTTSTPATGLVNGSFEDPNYPALPLVGGAMAAGWYYSDPAVGFCNIGPRHPDWAAGIQVVDGRQFVTLRQQKIWQNTHLQMAAGISYMLKAYVAGESGRADGFKMQMISSNTADGALSTNELSVQYYTPAVAATSGLQPVTLAYTATSADAGKYLQVAISSVPTTNDFLFIDNVTLLSAPRLAGDADENHRVNMFDLDALANQWLMCTDPLGTGCVKVGKYANMVYAPSITNVAVDGTLTEWSDAIWTPIADVVDGTATDVSNAMYACKWNPATNVIYLAVKLIDTDRNFIPNYGEFLSWDGQDDLIIYCDGANSESAGFSSGAGGNFSTAQQYYVGPTGSGNTTWQIWGGNNEYMPYYEDPGLVSACVVNGNNLSYEAIVVPFDWYDGLANDPDKSTTTTMLSNEKVLGFDVTIVTKHVTGYGAIQPNTVAGKWNDASKFAKIMCVQNTPTQCGAWGYESADANKDCKVNFKDFALLAGNWIVCNDPAGCP